MGVLLQISCISSLIPVVLTKLSCFSIINCWMIVKKKNIRHMCLLPFSLSGTHCLMAFISVNF